MSNLSNQNSRGTYRTSTTTLLETVSRISPTSCRLIELCATLDSASATDAWIWLCDTSLAPGATISAAQAAASLLGTPKKFTAGSTKSWQPPTEWTPFDNGVTLLVSTGQTAYVAHASGVFVFARVSYDIKPRGLSSNGCI